jgi:hypothetical protein
VTSQTKLIADSSSNPSFMIQPAHAIVAAIGSIATTINEADNMFVE